MKESIFDQIERLEHEQVVLCNDKHTGLKAIIAIHDTTLGPALGGTRMWNYASHEGAITDALRLSRGMTYKAAISGLNLGGGKAVIIGDPSTKSEELWRRYGKFVNSLNGKYITAEDVNTSTKDMEYIHMETKHVTGIPHYMGGSGDPSPFTAYGTFCGIKACANKRWGSDDLTGKKIMVQGVGHVGQYLVDHLCKAGAEVFICDINDTKLKETKAANKVTVVTPEEMFKTAVDIYAPCAMGATINDETIPQLTCEIIAGAANNQLKVEKTHGEAIKEKGILYAPDFLINAGGLMNVGAEAYNVYNKDKVTADVEGIYDRLHMIFNKAEAEGMTNQAAAIKMAEERIAAVGKINAVL